MPLPDPIREVLTIFRPLFTAPTWRKLMTLLTGTLLAQGRRTVTAALRHSGNSMAGNWSSFHQMLSLVRRWLPDREIKLMGDTAYTVLELGLHAQAQHVTLITTGRLDAILHDPPPERTSHTIGRPRVVGQRLPALETVLQDSETVWQKLTLDWYGEGERTLEICTGTALWYRYGYAPLPIRWVLTRDPSGKRPRHPPSFLPTQPKRQNRSCATKFRAGVWK